MREKGQRGYEIPLVLGEIPNPQMAWAPIFLLSLAFLQGSRGISRDSHCARGFGPLHWTSGDLKTTRKTLWELTRQIWEIIMLYL